MRPLRIALMAPVYWPEVRRGTERIVHDLGAALAERGHDVTLLTTRPAGGREITAEDGITVDRGRRLPQPGPLRWYEPYVANIPGAAARLVAGGFDVAHSFFPPESYAAALARRLGGPRFVATIHGITTREYLVARRYRLEMLERIVRDASAVTVLSEAAAEPVRRYLRIDPEIVPGGVRVADFAAEADRDAEPTVLCAASLADPRKRAGLLMEGFALAREEEPDLRLRLAGGADLPYFGEARLELLPGVERVDADRTDLLASAYAAAHASVLPSIEEAFGLVLIESLAAGTPVVGSRSGAVPEIVDDEAIGRIFEPDDPADLARAMLDAVALGGRPGVREACRSRAADFDWGRLAERVEGLYGRVLDSPPPA